MRKTINIGDLRVSYLEANAEGDLAVLFLHGNSQAATTFHRQLNSPELSGYRLLALDLPGHGLSERSKSYSIPMMVSAIVGFVEALGLKNYILAGHSLGGHLVLQALSRLNPMGIFITGTPPLSKPIDPSEFLPHPQSGVFYTQHVLETELEALLDDLYVSVEERTAGKFEFAQTDSSFRPALLASIGAQEFQDEINAWNTYSGVKKIMGGDSDKLINFESVKLKIPDTIVVTGGHNVHLENERSYSESLNQLISEIRPMKSVPREETVNG
jgi:pimeloyl-ACP methyl ester carboxylesterase